MAVPVAALAKIAAAALSDEDTRKRLGWIVAAICSPLILTLALICALISGSAEHNNSAVLLCFNGGTIPNKTPAEYVAYIEDMRRSFTLLDSAIDAVNDMTEDSDSLDGIRVKAVFYAIFFGEDTPSRRAHRQFVDCFVTYEERTRTVTAEDGTETEESYTVAIPIADIAAVYGNLKNVLHLEISVEQKSNADRLAKQAEKAGQKVTRLEYANGRTSIALRRSDNLSDAFVALGEVRKLSFSPKDACIIVVE